MTVVRSPMAYPTSRKQYAEADVGWAAWGLIEFPCGGDMTKLSGLHYIGAGGVPVRGQKLSRCRWRVRLSDALCSGS
jgi:hypothetical protein